MRPVGHEETPQESVLRTEDLVHNILEYFAVDPKSDWDDFTKYHETVVASRKQLYSAALISRGFAQPALNLLWRTIDSMKPLITLLPESLLSKDNGEYMVLHRRVEIDKELQRFNHYARKVEAFCIKRPDGTLKWPVYHTLTHQHGIPMPLLPRLHTLHIESLSAAAEDPLLFHIISPTLRRVTISTYSGAEIMRTILACLLSQAPDLLYFRCHARLPMDAMEWVLDFDLLEKLRLDFPFRAIFQPESGLNRLTHLTHLSLDFGAISNADLADNSIIPCEALTHLSISCKPSVVFKIIEALDLPNIREAHFSMCSSDGPPENRYLFTSIRRWARTLEVLTISGGQIMPLHAIYQHVRNSKASKFKRLRYFEVHDLKAPESAPELQDINLPLSTLASSLPNVEHLSLPPAHQIISYTTLCMLLVSCRKLRYLQIGVNAQTFPEESLRRNDFPCGVLESLSVGDGNDFDSFLIAHHLIRLFPQLKTVISSSERWNSVNRIIDFTRSLEMDKTSHPGVTLEFAREFSTQLSLLFNEEEVEGDS